MHGLALATQGVDIHASAIMGALPIEECNDAAVGDSVASNEASCITKADASESVLRILGSAFASAATSSSSLSLSLFSLSVCFVSVSLTHSHTHSLLSFGDVGACGLPGWTRRAGADGEGGGWRMLHAACTYDIRRVTYSGAQHTIPHRSRVSAGAMREGVERTGSVETCVA